MSKKQNPKRKDMDRDELNSNDNNPMTPDCNYEVGYGKPPKATQFKPGQSGNPRGRRKGKKNYKTILTGIAMRSVPIRDGDTKRTVPLIEALTLGLAQDGLRGNAKAAKTVLDELHRTGVVADEAEEADLSCDDAEILIEGLRRIQREAAHSIKAQKKSDDTQKKTDDNKPE